MGSEADPAAKSPSSDSIKSQLDRLATQVSGLQQRLDASIARRNEAIADRASKHVAAIVTAAEQSAAEIRAAAENDALTIRGRLMAETRSEVDRLRLEAQAEAARIRTEAQVEAARTREEAINQVSSEIGTVCARLSDELQASARAALIRTAGGVRSPSEIALAHPPPRPLAKRVAAEVEQAVGELQNAAAALEQSWGNLPTGGDG